MSSPKGFSSLQVGTTGRLLNFFWLVSALGKRARDGDWMMISRSKINSCVHVGMGETRIWVGMPLLDTCRNTDATSGVSELRMLPRAMTRECSEASPLKPAFFRLRTLVSRVLSKATYLLSPWLIRSSRSANVARISSKRVGSVRYISRIVW